MPVYLKVNNNIFNLPSSGLENVSVYTCSTFVNTDESIRLFKFSITWKLFKKMGKEKSRNIPLSPALFTSPEIKSLF